MPSIARTSLKKVFLGHGKVGNDNPIAPGIKYAIDPTPKFTYDPEKAKFHLKKAGLSSLKVDLSAADAAFTGAVDAAVLYQEHAKAAGIDINVVREPNDGYWDNVWLKKPWCASYWNGRPTMRLDVHHRLCRRRGLERHQLEESAASTSCCVQARSRDRRRRSAPPCMPRCSSCCTTTAAIIVLMFNSYVERQFEASWRHDEHWPPIGTMTA